MLKVLHVWPSLDQSSGGPLRAILELSANGERYGLHSELLGFGNIHMPDNPMDPRLIHWLPTSFPRRYVYVPQLRRWLTDNLPKYDGVVLHGMWLYPQAATASICQSLRIPYACVPHGMLDPWSLKGQGGANSLKKLLTWWLRDRRMHLASRGCIFTTKRERESARRLVQLPGRQLVVPPCGIGPTAKAPGPAQSRVTPPHGARVALFLGRVDRKKNVGFLIHAWARAEISNEWHLYIAGPCEPGYQRELGDLVRKYHLGRSVHFVGMVSGADKIYLLQRADWFLLPSKQENFGIAVLEAIACGCPVAISDQVAVAEHFHARSEILPLKLDAWVEFLRYRLPDEKLRQALIAADRRELLPRFRIETVARDWAETLTSLFQKAA